MHKRGRNLMQWHVNGGDHLRNRPHLKCMCHEHGNTLLVNREYISDNLTIILTVHSVLQQVIRLFWGYHQCAFVIDPEDIDNGFNGLVLHISTDNILAYCLFKLLNEDVHQPICAQCILVSTDTLHLADI
ncbi:uncharacterized protein LOC131258394 [Magnolia sinica]|uniref:uncharacterized protein LOC131258394 n=1 Tax=Magnolia sinica TaxID=86752 RepID=UPI00265A86F0|nr:uncharacterized protein LOC131258394 [Magnolia sinica]